MSNRNKRQMHAWNPDEIERLRGVRLPAKLKCIMCQKNFNEANFSQKQLTDVRYQVSRTGRITTNPKCFRCTGGQLVEMECVMCHKTKGLEDFAKTQRKNPDNARCWNCTESQVSREAVNERDYVDPNRAFLRTEGSDGRYPDYWTSVDSASGTASNNGEYGDSEPTDGTRRQATAGGVDLPENLRTMSIGGRVSDALIDSEHSDMPAAGTRPSTWSDVAGTRSWHTGTAASSSARSRVGSSSYGAPGARSTAGSSHSFNSSIAERSQGSNDIEMRNGFAKVRAYKPAPKDDAWAKDDGESSSSSSDDDDYDAPSRQLVDHCDFPLTATHCDFSLAAAHKLTLRFLDLKVVLVRFTMAGRRPRGGGIRGPHSALTDFLAANNISAQEIRDSYRDRLQRAEQDAAAADNGEGPSNAGEDQQAESSAMAAERSRKRKRNQDEAIAKIKKGKAAKKTSKKKKGADESEEDFMDMYKKAKKLPGQLENCELCDKRFTVTPYSQAGPEGGLLCTPCGKELKKEAKAQEKAKQKPVVRKGRRKIESNRLDGLAVRGPKSLQQLCIEKLAQHSEDIDELGEMPENIMNRISEIFSKKRAMNSTTMKLFLQPDMDSVPIHEAAYLETEDFDQIFAVCPTVKKLSLRNCCQFKDSNVDYLIEKAKSLVDIQLLGANLVSNDKWIELFIARGKDLSTDDLLPEP
ncbi:hypothetical protein OPT61_g2445 [Boeremia exigua]|uniref:Uncharacterized protein n=1 Tax=Boeremia exigua TaxID=749465 RepID=A0ACC2ILP6_9PLEO|nr:hypothetical protein OPT61_g2445 [Boeremia exigua]